MTEVYPIAFSKAEWELGEIILFMYLFLIAQDRWGLL